MLRWSMSVALVLGAILGCGAHAPPNDRSLQLPKRTVPGSSVVLPISRKLSLSRSNTLHDAWYQTDPVMNLPLSGPLGGEGYTVDIIIAGEPYTVLLDTGSPDLWIPDKNAICSQNGTDTPCAFGSARFDSNTTSATPYNSSFNFNITYGMGGVLGTPYTGAVTLGEVTVLDAEFNVATNVRDWPFDGHSSGLLGLSNPIATSLFESTNSTNDSQANREPYTPWVFKAVEEGLIDPYFSLALNRPTLEDEQELANLTEVGYLTLGGIPDNDTVPVTEKSVTLPNMNYTIKLHDQNISTPVYWSIQVDSWNYDGADPQNSTSSVAALDSGTTLIYAPKDVVEGYNKLVDPPPTFNDTLGLFVCDCNTTMPPLSLTIGGEIFSFQPEDLIYGFEENVCVVSLVNSTIAVGPKKTPLYILGDRFMVNILAAFDVDRNEITIFERAPY